MMEVAVDRQVEKVAVDAALEAQLIVAWAGEAGEERRLGWWRTDMVAEFGGEDLFRRLMPRTSDWAVLQVVREAVRRRDAELRSKVHDPDQVVSLFRLGFTLDERVDERLQELKRRGSWAPLSKLQELRQSGWDRGVFEAWVKEHGPARFEASPAGRQLSGAPPVELGTLVRQLVGALAPLSEEYPLPHFRRKR